MAWILAVIDFALTLGKENFHTIQFPFGSANNAEMGRQFICFTFVLCSLWVMVCREVSLNKTNI